MEIYWVAELQMSILKIDLISWRNDIFARTCLICGVSICLDKLTWSLIIIYWNLTGAGRNDRLKFIYFKKKKADESNWPVENVGYVSVEIVEIWQTLVKVKLLYLARLTALTSIIYI